MVAKRINGEAGPSFASQAKANGLSLTRSTKKRSAKLLAKGDEMNDFKANTAPSSVSQDRKQPLPTIMEQPAKDVKKSGREADATPLFASQAKANGLSVNPKTRASSLVTPVIFSKRSSRKAGATPSFASQAKARGLFITQKISPSE